MNIRFLKVLSIILSFCAIDGIFANYERPDVVITNGLTQPLDFSGDDGASVECQRDENLFLGALRNYTPWALQMYDASSKTPSGVITGNYKQLGNYDECLRVVSDHGFVGKACSANLYLTILNTTETDHLTPDIMDLLKGLALSTNPQSWRSGATIPYEAFWCIPSSCEAKNVKRALEVSLKPLLMENRVSLLVNSGQCHTLDRPQFMLADWLYISILLLFAVFIGLSTTYDLIGRSKAEKPASRGNKHILLTSFSLYTNGRSLFNTSNDKGENIGCLDAIRFLSICWIVYGHTFYLQVAGAPLDMSSIPHMHEDWMNFLLLNGNIVTDTFLLLGGILLTYCELGRKEKHPHTYKLNIGLLYIHRYLRLTPAYAIVIGFYATIFYKIGSGPLWDTWVGANQDYCIENWWSNLLYINNYVNIGRICMSQSWYLSVDMQLIWLSPILLYPLIVLGIKHALTIAVLVISLVAAILTPMLITYFYQLSGTILYFKEQTDLGSVYQEIYTRVYTRAGPYIIGLILGCLLRKCRTNPPKLSFVWVSVGWIVAVASGVAVIVGPRGMYYADHKYNAIEAAFYAGFHRTAFAIVVGWIVFTSVLGYAGPIGTFLSWRGWSPLGKLTYSAYLTHYIVLLYNGGSIRTNGNLTIYETTHAFLGNIILTMLISLILCLCFEFPFSRLMRPLTQQNERRSFTSGSFNPTIGAFGSHESTNEIYRSCDDVVTTVSQSCENICDHYGKQSSSISIYDNSIATHDLETTIMENSKKRDGSRVEFS